MGMARVLLHVLCALCASAAASAADDHRVNFLEQEVRHLHRQVQTLSRRVDELSRPGRHVDRARAARPASAPLSPASDEWLSAARWQRLRPGMGELEVIEALGPPTSMREENGARVLFYAMELGASGFLSGSVTMRNRVVEEVRIPSLQ
jgi:hypothetical protein